jgi:TetR/AcrR family transcriptional regulator, transcriptional repressor for nem operon
LTSKILGVVYLDVNYNPKGPRREPRLAMRKSREEAALTRKRIVATGAREFRKSGIVATGLADLMKAADLTHGGFYKHFESKDQLVAEACAEAAQSITGMLEAVVSDGGSAAAKYLSTWHRDNPAEGCPLSSMGIELSRSDQNTRSVATACLQRLVELVAGQFGKVPPAEARRKALVAVSTMIGALTVSRIVTDLKLSAEILKEAQKSIVE